ncbi:MAG: hypothetical protein RR885_01460 [Oscillospiraceae bacterium]
MASTNKTANLSLNQWTLDDPFLMEDFNADNRKLDAAIWGLNAKAEFNKIKEITVTTKDSAQIDLDVSDIDFGKYYFLILTVDAIEQCVMRINLSKDASYYGIGYSGAQNESLVAIVRGHKYIFYPMKNGNAVVEVLGLGSNNLLVGKTEIKYSEIKTMNLIAHSNWAFNDRSTFTIWGVK